MNEIIYGSLHIDKEIHKKFKKYAIDKDSDMKSLLENILIDKMRDDPIE